MIAPGGRLAARWPAWTLLAAVAFFASLVLGGLDIAARGTGPWFAAAVIASWRVAAAVRRIARTGSRAVRPTALDLPAPPADRAAARAYAGRGDEA
jgi:hypothetical protein